MENELMMTKEHFVNCVAEYLKDTETGKLFKSITAQDVKKVSGGYYGVVATDERGVGICVNLNEVYNAYVADGGHKNPEFFLSNGLHYCVTALDNAYTEQQFGGINTAYWDSILDRIPVDKMRMVLASRAKVEEFPHINIFGDLAVIFRVLMFENETGVGSAVVSDGLLAAWGITVEELFALLCEKSPIYYPASLMSMKQKIAMMTGEDTSEDGWDDDEFLILTCTGNDLADQYGAGAVLYPGQMERIAERVGGNYYVLPSSVHELLILRDGLVAPSELLEMVTQINASEVAPEDQLSNAVYYFDADRGIMTEVA